MSVSRRILKSNCLPLIGWKADVNVNTKSESGDTKPDNMPVRGCSSVLDRICQMFGVDQFISVRGRLVHSKSEIRSEELLIPALLCHKDTPQGTLLVALG